MPLVAEPLPPCHESSIVGTPIVTDEIGKGQDFMGVSIVKKCVITINIKWGRGGTLRWFAEDE